MSEVVISFTKQDFAREIQFVMGPRFVLTEEKLDGFINEILLHMEHSKPYVLYCLTDIEDRIALYFMEEIKTLEEDEFSFIEGVGHRCGECSSFVISRDVWICDEDHNHISEEHICPLGRN